MFTGASGDEGLQKLISDLLLKCDLDVQKQLAQNLVLSGGSTLFKGFDERLTSELTSLQPHLKFKVRNPLERDSPIQMMNERLFKNWRGALCFIQMSEFLDNMATREDYKEGLYC